MKNTKHTFRVTKNSEENNVFLYPKLDYGFFGPSSHGFNYNLKRHFDDFCEKVQNMTIDNIRVYLVNTEEREGINFYNHIGAGKNIGYTNGRADYEYTDPIFVRGQQLPTLVARGHRHTNDVYFYSDDHGKGITNATQNKLHELLGEQVKTIVWDEEVLQFLKDSAIANARKEVQKYLDEQFKDLQTAYEDFDMTTIVKKG